MQRINNAGLKADARDALRGRRPRPWLVALVFFIISYVISTLTMRLTYPNVNFSALMNGLMTESLSEDELYGMITENRGGVIARILNFALNIMDIMIGLGFTSYCLKAARRLEAGVGDLFDAFGNFLNLLWLNIVISVLVALWSMLLVIPGIIALYRYSMAVYLMLDDPDKGALQCIRESKELMRGRKMDLFLLDLSFLGWFLLSAIPFVSLYVLPYYETAHANFYRAVTGRYDAPEHVDVVI